MGSSFGTSLKVSVFGQSHAPAIGCVVEGLPAGFKVDLDALARLMARRAPGSGPWATKRSEADEPRILSGLNAEGETCGTPLAIVIENADVRSKDYDDIARIPRPGHADFTAYAKWGSAHDVRGGGIFSGRLTAPLVAAGGIALQMLEAKGVRIGAHLARVAGVDDEALRSTDTSAEGTALLTAQLDALAERSFPVIDEGAGERIRAAIEEARLAGDSVGGIVECVACGLPAGIGGPIYDGIESAIARIAFGIPAVKGIEFGAGFRAADMRGSESNDPWCVRDGKVVPAKNDAGGNLGGITTGAPVSFRIAIKPTSSIAIEQDSVDLTTLEPAKLVVSGRHDPCIAPRAVPVAEAAMALALLDSWLSFPGTNSPFALLG